MRHIKPPQPIPTLADSDIAVFLGGSIEMGRAERWQDKVRDHFTGWNDDLIILNPRRDDWDSSWKQDPTPGTKFHEQVTWEIAAQEKADILIYYFADDTASPITLLELGSYGTAEPDYPWKNVLVRVTEGYFRYGNVRIFCDHNGLTVCDSLEDLLSELDHMLIH